jgi:S-DNA-T family DNA segregation ATPase FtsK/SpoIIIE
MDTRKTDHAGSVRTVPITRDTPLNVLEFDEIGALTRYVGDRKTREQIIERVAVLNTQGRALGYTVRGYVQEPTKDTVPVRDLFPRRLCMRVATKPHVSMALGDTAWDRGAWANRIPENQPGVGYLFGDGIREPLRVRAAWVPDHAIKDLERFVTGPAPVALPAPGRVLPLPPARRRCRMTTTETTQHDTTKNDTAQNGTDEAVDQDTLTRAQKALLALSNDVATQLAEDHGVCVRPLAMRRIDTTTGRVDVVPVPCGSTREDQCRPCSDKARRLRMVQCRQGPPRRSPRGLPAGAGGGRRAGL